MSQRESIETLTEQIEKIAEDRGLDLAYEESIYAAFAWNYSYEPSEIEDWKDEAEESFSGTYDSDADFAENLADELGLYDSAASWPTNYIDWESAANDIMMNYFEAYGHYFRNI